jgi:hypothetical protein
LVADFLKIKRKMKEALPGCLVAYTSTGWHLIGQYLMHNLVSSRKGLARQVED